MVQNGVVCSLSQYLPISSGWGGLLVAPARGARLTGNGTKKMNSNTAATAHELMVTRTGFMSGNLPRLCKFLPRRKRGQPIKDPAAAQANISLTTCSRYGSRNE